MVRPIVQSHERNTNGIAQAPSEAEAQCAEFCRGGIAFGTGSEDMDTLTFNSPIILRHLTFSEARKMPIDQIKLDVALEGLELTMDQVSARMCFFSFLAEEHSAVHRHVHSVRMRLP